MSGVGDNIPQSMIDMHEWLKGCIENKQQVTPVMPESIILRDELLMQAVVDNDLLWYPPGLIERLRSYLAKLGKDPRRYQQSFPESAPTLLQTTVQFLIRAARDNRTSAFFSAACAEQSRVLVRDAHTATIARHVRSVIDRDVPVLTLAGVDAYVVCAYAAEHPDVATLLRALPEDWRCEPTLVEETELMLTCSPNEVQQRRHLAVREAEKLFQEAIPHQLRLLQQKSPSGELTGRVMAPKAEERWLASMRQPQLIPLRKHVNDSIKTLRERRRKLHGLVDAPAVVDNIPKGLKEIFDELSCKSLLK